MSLLVTAWVFFRWAHFSRSIHRVHCHFADSAFRITGAAFNPAVSFALWMIGGLSNRRLLMIVPAQMVGGVAAAGLAKSLTLGYFGVVSLVYS